MVKVDRSRGQFRPQAVSMKVGDEMIGSLHLKERWSYDRLSSAKELMLVRVRGGIMGLLVGQREELDALDLDLRVKVRLKRIDVPDATHPRPRYVFELVNQWRPDASFLPAGSAASDKREASRLTDKAIPPVTERAAFRNFGYGLLKTNSRDKGQLKELCRTWIDMVDDDVRAYSRSLRDGETIDLEAYRHYKGIYELAKKLGAKVNGWASMRDEFYRFLNLRAEPTEGMKISHSYYSPW